MKLSTKSRYAVMALYDMLCCKEKKPVSAADISKRQGISIDYLDQILSQLRKSGIVESVRGPGGGYKLAKEAKLIRIGDIIRATDGPIVLVDCVDDKSACQKSDCCSTRVLWHKFSKEIEKMLDKVTLEELVK